MRPLRCLSWIEEASLVTLLRRCLPILLAASGAAVGLSPGLAADREPLRALVQAQGVSGQEEPVRREILKRLPAGARAEVDGVGNLVLFLGSGPPSRLVVTALDEPGYVVSRIQDDGYLRVQRLARLPLSPLYDQFIQGQPVRIGTPDPSRWVPGVAAILSTHLQRGRRPAAAVRPPSDVDLVLDVGARSAAEARDAGVRLLAPVTLRKDLAFLSGSKVAGPSLEGRAGCAALLELARRLDPRRLKGQLILAWSTQSWVGFRGSSRLARRFAADEVLVVDPYASDPPPLPPTQPAGILGRGPFLGRREEKSGISGELEAGLRRAARGRSIPVQFVRVGSLHEGKPFLGRRVAVVGIPVQFPGTPAEMVDLRDLDSLVEWLIAYLEDGPQ